MCQTDQNCSTRRHEGGGVVLVSLRGSSLSRAVVLLRGERFVAERFVELVRAVILITIH